MRARNERALPPLRLQQLLRRDDVAVGRHLQHRHEACGTVRVRLAAPQIVAQHLLVSSLQVRTF